jgi:hypothetical protein
MSRWKRALLAGDTLVNKSGLDSLRPDEQLGNGIGPQ